MSRQNRLMRAVCCLPVVLLMTASAWAQGSGRPFPEVQAPPPDAAAPAVAPQSPAPPAPATTSSRPNVLERPWTDAADGPYARAQAVAAERLVPDTRLVGLSPYPDRFRSPVPSPFRYEPGASGWSGGLLFPGLPFPAIGVRPSPPGLGLGRPPGTRR